MWLESKVTLFIYCKNTLVGVFRWPDVVKFKSNIFYPDRQTPPYCLPKYDGDDET